MRFERCDGAGGAKVFSRGEVNPAAGDDPASFLARLWALFGAPDPCDGGFSYAIHDRDSGLAFEAYSAASGPSYGGDPRVRLGDYRSVLAAFERLLDETAPVDCEWTFGADVEYGGGQVAIGWRDGRPFHESRDRRTPPETAGSYEDCVRIAREYEGGYGESAGWHQCLDRVLPAPPDEVDWNDFHYEDNVGFTLDDDGEPVMLYIGPSGSPEGVPLAAIRFAKPLPAIAKRWLDAYARWRQSAVPRP